MVLTTLIGTGRFSLELWAHVCSYADPAELDIIRRLSKPLRQLCIHLTWFKLDGNMFRVLAETEVKDGTTMVRLAMLWSRYDSDYTSRYLRRQFPSQP